MIDITPASPFFVPVIDVVIIDDAGFMSVIP